jgi:retron-type reverse transcriptase
MGQHFKNLFAEVIHRDNLWRAYHKAARGKRETFGYLQFRQNEAANLARLGELLQSGEYVPGEPRCFVVREPKARQISALPFVDRVAQHALCNVIEPIFDRVFVPQSYACRRGKGTHRAAVAVQALLRKSPGAWVLKTDFAKYFSSIDREILHREVRRKVSCRRTLALLKTFIPPEGRGLPIGNLTSQLAANIYGHILDRWLIHQVGVTSFVRYMDDVVIVGHSLEAARLLQALMESFTRTAMCLSFSRWSIQPASRGVNFCGYRIWPTHKLLRRRSVVAAKRKIVRFRKAGDGQALTRFIASWRGHARWANSFNLLNRLGVVP